MINHCLFYQGGNRHEKNFARYAFNELVSVVWRFWLCHEMNDERNQMIIGKAAVLSIKWIVLLNIAALFVMAALDVSSVAIVLLALSTIMIPILNIILQVHLNRTM